MKTSRSQHGETMIALPAGWLQFHPGQQLVEDEFGGSVCCFVKKGDAVSAAKGTLSLRHLAVMP